MENYTLSDLNAQMQSYRNSFYSAKNNADHVKDMIDSQQIFKSNSGFGNMYKIYDSKLDKFHDMQKIDNDITVFYRQYDNQNSTNYTYSSSENGDKSTIKSAFSGNKKFSIDYTDTGLLGEFRAEEDNNIINYIISYESYTEDDELVEMQHDYFNNGTNSLEEVLCNTYDKDNKPVRQHRVVTDPENITTEDTVYDYENNLKTQKSQNKKSTEVKTWSLKEDKEQLDNVAIDSDNQDGFDKFYRYEYSQDGKLLKEYFNDANNPDSDYIIQHNYNELGLEESKSIDYKVNDNWNFFQNAVDTVSSWLGFGSRKDVTIEDEAMLKLRERIN